MSLPRLDSEFVISKDGTGNYFCFIVQLAIKLQAQVDWVTILCPSTLQPKHSDTEHKHYTQ